MPVHASSRQYDPTPIAVVVSAARWPDLWTSNELHCRNFLAIVVRMCFPLACRLNVRERSR